MHNDHEHNTDEKPDDLLAGLRQLAERLDAQQFPGRAWTPPVCPAAQYSDVRRPLRHWSIGLSVAAAVAILALGVHFSVPSRKNMNSQLSTVVHYEPKEQVEEVQPVEQAYTTIDVESLGGSRFINLPVAEFYYDDSEVSELVVVEDFESYSIIDMSTGSPLISYFRKDSLDAIDVTPASSPAIEATDDHS